MGDNSHLVTRLHQLEALDSLEEADVALERDLLTARKKRRSTWVKDWILRRPEENLLYKEIVSEDQAKFKQAFRMTPAVFEKLLDFIKGDICKQDTTMRRAISSTTRLQVCLRFLASGANYQTLEDIFRIPHNTISTIITETTHAIWDRLSAQYLSCPSTEEEWEDVAKGFWDAWQYPYCIGAVDGKHVQVRSFPHSGSMFRNYKGTFSLVLFAICDSQYKFLYCNVGCAGSANDAAIWLNSAFKKKLEEGQLGCPSSPSYVKYHVVGDDIFGLSETLMKPFPRRNLNRKELIFNYRLSRARRVIENAFGILANRFRVLHAPLCLSMPNCANVIKACVVLHNFLLSECRQNYLQPADFEEDEQGLPKFTGAEHMPGLSQLEANRTGNTRARDQRAFLAHYFWNEGAVPFQWKQLQSFA